MRAYLFPGRSAPLLLVPLLISGAGFAQCEGGGGIGAVPPSPAGPANAGPGPSGPASPARPGGRPGGGPSSPGPSSPASPPGAAPGFPGGPTTPFGDAFDTTWWALWWEHNKVAYLDLDRLRPKLPTTGSMERVDPLIAARRGLTYGAIYEDLVPIMREQLEQAKDTQLIGELLIALARIGEAPRIDGKKRPSKPLRPLIGRYLEDGNPSIAERAALALGLLGDPVSARMLGDLLRDTEAGRELVGGGRVPNRLRAQAAHGLGMVAAHEGRHLARYCVHELAQVLSEDEAGPDLEAACIAALGVARIDRIGNDDDSPSSASASRSALVALVLERLGRRDAGDPARVHAPTALARLLPGLPEDSTLREKAIGRMIDLAHPRSRERDSVRRSAVLALGMLGDADDDDLDRGVREALMGAAKSGDVTTRGFALVSLGQVAGRGGEGEDPFAASKEVEAYLAQHIVRGKSWSKPWAALGLGVAGRGKAQADLLVAKSAADALLSELRDSRSTIVSPALALGVGLLGDVRGRIEIQQRLADGTDEESRAAYALALGMLDTKDAHEALRAAQVEAAHWPRLTESVALGRRLSGDDQVRADLVHALEDCDCYQTVLSVSRALAWTGDATVVPDLQRILEDSKRPERVRAAATLALGWLADEELQPFDTVYSVGTNYADAPSTMTDPLGYGLLDLF